MTLLITSKSSTLPKVKKKINKRKESKSWIGYHCRNIKSIKDYRNKLYVKFIKHPMKPIKVTMLNF